MMFVEVCYPPGALSAGQRRILGERLVTDVMQAGDSDAPEAVIVAGRSLCHVLFHETDDWYVAGRSREPGAAPPYLVRVTVPESWREEMAPHLVKAFTQVFADIDAQPSRLYDEPVCWIHVLGLREGGAGAMGRPLSSADLLRMITKPHRDAPRSAEGLPPGTGLDPVCGMTVPFKHAAATVEHEGTRYAFCSKGCHEVFAEDHALA
ncbi:YHS domain-containing protein [Amycolatopsis alkalitolerans]|uniref:YHS domain-containing protein n=1 Tax=Amycolatopsis alkalitolerans TaxID=2547244 RepID=A0A5C4LRP7_9PSEU|nr:YHS domain-containing protein [Amycolatopsis alkalitolerans]TNC20198.1 YHS domain-containing protein [Amycolatopsis alkalitolerans]